MSEDDPMKPEIRSSARWGAGPPVAGGVTSGPKTWQPPPAATDVADGASRARRTPHRAIRVTRRIDAPPEQVFHAWLDAAIARSWLFATAARPIQRADIDARVGGAFRFVDVRGEAAAEYRGAYVALVPHRRIAFTLVADDYAQAMTRVSVEIAPRRAGCAVTLTHEDLPREHAAHARDRWIGILYGLAATLVPCRFRNVSKERDPCNT
jgi:uncharacterized protein YndB with AHSA1/START domain